MGAPPAQTVPPHTAAHNTPPLALAYRTQPTRAHIHTSGILFFLHFFLRAALFFFYKANRKKHPKMAPGEPDLGVSGVFRSPISGPSPPPRATRFQPASAHHLAAQVEGSSDPRPHLPPAPHARVTRPTFGGPFRPFRPNSCDSGTSTEIPPLRPLPIKHRATPRPPPCPPQCRSRLPRTLAQLRSRSELDPSRPRQRLGPNAQPAATFPQLQFGPRPDLPPTTPIDAFRPLA